MKRQAAADPAIIAILKDLKTPGYIENRIEEIIDNYSIKYNCNVQNIKQLQWNDVLLHIYKSLFSYNNERIVNYNDIDFLNYIADIYISICFRYSKSTSLYGYSIYSGITYSIIKNWNTDTVRSISYIDTDNNIMIEYGNIALYKALHPDNKVIEISNSIYYGLCKKIVESRQHSLTDMTENGSIPALALGKIEYGWIEGKDNQLKAALLENAVTGSAMLADYKQIYGISGSTTADPAADPAATATAQQQQHNI